MFARDAQLLDRLPSVIVGELEPYGLPNIERVPVHRGCTAHVRSLGCFQVSVKGRSLSRPGGRAARLFKYLLCARDHRAQKDEIAETLWPDDSNGLKNLHAAAHDVRAWLGDGALLSFSYSEYGLNSCGIDADEFDELIGRARAFWSTDPVSGRDYYQAALVIYRGPLLPDELYAEWITTRRQRLQERFIEAALKVGNCLLNENDLEGALAVTAEISEIDEAIEDAVRLEMEALARLGRRGQALRRFERLRSFLDRELHCRPDPATEAVRARVFSL